MDSAKSQLVDRLKSANTILVTVSKNPSVDQLAACIGLTLIINKLNKHGSAVYSGDTPSTIEFLKPEDTIEKNTDSLRDFIIALDKDKADKLRYKVEDQMVRIFITPYRTSLDESDLEFSQGDFNVELIVAIGVNSQDDLDQAITAHGRILHDATVASVNLGGESNLGSINWTDSQASSLCELVTDLAKSLGDGLFDEQIATALLTGIVAETDRFSNEKTSSLTMAASAELMSAGANQQLVATQLAEESVSVQSNQHNESESNGAVEDNGTLNIDHEPVEHEDNQAEEETSLPEPVVEDDNEQEDDQTDDDQPKTETKFVSEPPQLGGTLTANSQPEAYDPSTDPLSNVPTPSVEEEGLTKANDVAPPKNEPILTGFTPPPPAWVPPFEDKQLESNVEQTLSQPTNTLMDLEKSVNSPHLHANDIENARDQVDAVLAESTSNEPPKPTEALNAMPLGEPLHQDAGQTDGGNVMPAGLDPALFSEPPQNEAVPPVPPPIPVQYNFPSDQATEQTENTPPAEPSS